MAHQKQRKDPYDDDSPYCLFAAGLFFLVLILTCLIFLDDLVGYVPVFF